MDDKGGKVGGVNWEIGIGMYTFLMLLICIK